MSVAETVAPRAAPPAMRSDRNWFDWLVLGLLVAPFVVGVVAVLLGDSSIHLVSDNAANQLRMSDIGSHAVLLGPFSRDNWSHPGPLLYYLLAIPFRLFGSRSAGIAVGALVINGASVAGMLLVARGRGGRLFLGLTAMTLGLLMVHLGEQYLRDPWNPYLTVLPFGLLVFLVWDLSCGAIRRIPLVVLVGTFCVQTHIAYLPLVPPLVVWGLLGWWRSTPPGTHTEANRAARGPALLALAIGVVLWIPVAVDQLVGNHNLSAIVSYFTNGAPARGLNVAWRIVGNEFSPRANWIFGHEPASGYTAEPVSIGRTPIPIFGVLALLAILSTWRRQTRAARYFVVTVAVGLVASWIAIARTTGAVFDYRLRFVWIVASFLVLGAIWFVAGAIAASPVHLPTGVVRGLTGLCAVVVAGTALTCATSAATSNLPDSRRDGQTEALTRQLLPRLTRGHGALLVRPTSFASQFYVGGIMLRLEEHGEKARLDNTKPARLAYGSHRVFDRRNLAGVLSIVTGADIPKWASTTGQRVVAYSGGVPARSLLDEQTRLRRLIVRRQAGDHRASVENAIERAQRNLQAVAVFFAPPTPTPGR